MSKTLNSVVFDIHSQEKDAIALRDYATDTSTLLLRRTAAKRTKDFPGMRKSEMKHTMVGADGAIIGIQMVTTSILATATATQVNYLNGVTKAAMADPIYDDLIVDERIPFGL